MKLPIQFFTWLVILVLSACSKNKTAPALPAGSVSIQGLITADTLGTGVPVTKDTLMVIGLKALLNGQPSPVSHRVLFDVDTMQLAAYQAKYGNALLLPASSYFFYHPNCSIPAGATLSDSAEINLMSQSKLKPLTTYVLPVIIRSVDGQPDGIAPGQALYVVVHR